MNVGGFRNPTYTRDLRACFLLRGKFVAALKSAFQHGQLHLAGDLARPMSCSSRQGFPDLDKS